MRRIFNQQHFSILSQRHQPIHIRQRTTKVHHNDGLRLGGDGPLHTSGIDVEAVWFNVYEYRNCPHAGNTGGGGHKADGRDNHFIASTNPRRRQ